jgi:hypothetical protein
MCRPVVTETKMGNHMIVRGHRGVVITIEENHIKRTLGDKNSTGSPFITSIREVLRTVGTIATTREEAIRVGCREHSSDLVVAGVMPPRSWFKLRHKEHIPSVSRRYLEVLLRLGEQAEELFLCPHWISVEETPGPHKTRAICIESTEGAGIRFLGITVDHSKAVGEEVHIKMTLGVPIDTGILTV